MNNIIVGIKNIIAWFPIIWQDRDWDWFFLARIMEFKMRNMSKALKYGNHVGCEKDSKRLLICAELLKRLQEDSSDDLIRFYDVDSILNNLNADTTDRKLFINRMKQHHQRMKEWQEMLGIMIGKHLRSWWD